VVNATVNETVVVVEGLRVDGLSVLAVVTFIVALFAPAVASRSGLATGLSFSFVALVSALLSLREYYASSGLDAELWRATFFIALLFFAFAFTVAVLRAMNSYTRGLKAPRLPDLGV